MEDFTLRFQQLLSTAKRYCRPPVDVENIAADILMWEFENQRRASNATIRNRCYDELRHLQVVRDDKSQRGVSSSFEERPGDVRSLEHFEKMQSVLDGNVLSTEEKSVVCYVYWMGKTLKEVSEITNMRLNVVSSLHKKALDKLKERIGNDRQGID